MIYQGTVLGPLLWNAFFLILAWRFAPQDSSDWFIRATCAFRAVDNSVADDQAHRMLAECQTSLRRW
eukprot:8913212-Pyramimonas_sp.AAC.1